MKLTILYERKDGMESKICFCGSEVLEICGLMDRIAFEEEKKDILDLELVEIYEVTNKEITPLLKNDILFFSKLLFTQQILHYCVLILKIKTIKEIIEYLKILSDEEFLDVYLMSIIERKHTDGEELIKKELEEDDYLTEKGFSYQAYKEFVENFKVLRLRLELYFEQFYERIFLPHKDRIMKKVEEEKKSLEDLYKQNPKLFIKRFIKTNGDKLLKEESYRAFFYVNVTYPNHITFTMEKNCPEKIYISFGVGVLELMRINMAEELMRCLGEPTKMKIVKLLSKKAMYASEVAMEIELNRATISHHLAQLVQVGAIMIAYTEGNKAYYKLNYKEIKMGLEDFYKILERGEDNQNG